MLNVRDTPKSACSSDRLGGALLAFTLLACASPTKTGDVLVYQPGKYSADAIASKMVPVEGGAFMGAKGGLNSNGTLYSGSEEGEALPGRECILCCLLDSDRLAECVPAGPAKLLRRDATREKRRVRKSRRARDDANAGAGKEVICAWY